jgi:hypothetical protein
LVTDRDSAGHAKQQPAIPFQGSWPDVEILAEQLRPNALVLLAPLRGPTELARFALELEWGLDRKSAATRSVQASMRVSQA